VLLLDLRDLEEFTTCHIIGALCFPAPNINRDKIPPEIFAFVFTFSTNRKEYPIT
jgi:rhodanese-related sulfurtransferase